MTMGVGVIVALIIMMMVMVEEQKSENGCTSYPGKAGSEAVIH